MAFRISATTSTDAELLELIRDLAWKERADISEIIRQAFNLKLNEETEKRSATDQSEL